jgi:membrane associated rhomboid family serine protease
MFDDFKNAFQRHNNGHVQLIIVNLVIFVVFAVLWVITQFTGLQEVFAVLHKQFQIPAQFSEFVTRPWTIVTYMFMHDLTGILHILFNMLVLYWFGKLFVEYLGSDKLVALYLLGGLAGAVLYLMAYNLIPNPPAFLADRAVMVGASAAIFAVMVATATLLPNYTFFLLFLGPVRIKYIAAVYIFISFLGTVNSNAGGNIAHLGGALMGFVYMKQLQIGVNWGGWITVTLEWFKDLFKEKRKVKVSYRKERPATTVKSQPAEKPAYTQEEIDRILDKISAGGYESLTKDEKEKLFNASKK